MFLEILPQDVAAWLERGAKVVDVREPWEFAGGRVPGSVNVPLGEFIARLGELTSPLVLACASGVRSGAAAEYLDRHGFGEVANLVGGMHLWEDAGLPVEK
ncbi:MAG: rhodanese-like domain-containing protein [Trueperaceae bacterium]